MSLGGIRTHRRAPWSPAILFVVVACSAGFTLAAPASSDEPAAASATWPASLQEGLVEPTPARAAHELVDLRTPEAMAAFDAQGLRHVGGEATPFKTKAGVVVPMPGTAGASAALLAAFGGGAMLRRWRVRAREADHAKRDARPR